jgi:hypothetical protein
LSEIRGIYESREEKIKQENEVIQERMRENLHAV